MDGIRIVQFQDQSKKRKVGLVESNTLHILKSTKSLYSLAIESEQKEQFLTNLIKERVSSEIINYDDIIERKALLPPIDHSEPHRCIVTGTGLTHLGSAKTRSNMHINNKEKLTNETDSMKLFRKGLENGKPPKGEIGIQPEWFYKGNGLDIIPPEGELIIPEFSKDGGEEPEIASIYFIDKNHMPRRIGYTIGNEFSDHVMEKENYLYLAHSKLRTFSFGPEIFIGELPPHLEGKVSIQRKDSVIWENTFLTGEANMSHSLANIEHHHFKYRGFRNPGDIHIHFWGTSSLSFSDAIKIEDNDRIEIGLSLFEKPLRNTIKKEVTTQTFLNIKQL